ncbi:hypothetical protein B4U80_14905 [Leptotrombidium deliense]|uniref:AMP-dependent synthetase/ligase domain-containing protein n=1 Tax=Leptotrombidium deliense TaxID=299467 RepID=A0A443S3C1_9ACAR|nr:hypothetical protein B4U80_14905 [Leptotrombidium deliense]
MSLNANDMAKINFSSGTTGKPKAVFSSHKNLLGFGGMCSPVQNIISENDTAACIAHFGHGGENN